MRSSNSTSGWINLPVKYGASHESYEAWSTYESVLHSNCSANLDNVCRKLIDSQRTPGPSDRVDIKYNIIPAAPRTVYPSPGQPPIHRAICYFWKEYQQHWNSWLANLSTPFMLRPCCEQSVFRRKATGLASGLGRTNLGRKGYTGQSPAQSNRNPPGWKIHVFAARPVLVFEPWISSKTDHLPVLLGDLPRPALHGYEPMTERQ
jgi:hypothetical protein